MEAKLLIELDGISHDARADYDTHRDECLGVQGFTVLRVANEEVKNDLNGVIETILPMRSDF